VLIGNKESLENLNGKEVVIGQDFQKLHSVRIYHGNDTIMLDKWQKEPCVSKTSDLSSKDLASTKPITLKPYRAVSTRRV
jgi:hypothetical protein